MPSIKNTKKPERTGGTAFQQVQNQLKWVDLIIEVCDARAPVSSRHPRNLSLFGSKPRLVVLAKEDLAEFSASRNWVNAFGTVPNQKALSLALKTSKGKSKLIDLVLSLTEAKRKQLKEKGLLPRPARVCVVGIPNVGKSSLINWLVGQKRVRVGDKPGVTRGQQWVRVHPQVELLDTPGVLPADEIERSVQLKLALLNLVTAGSYDTEEVARQGLHILKTIYPERLKEYLSTDSLENMSLGVLATKRNLLGTGGIPDVKRAASVFLNDLRSGKLGEITLDRPDGKDAEIRSAAESSTKAGPG
jgi:ribosome biogenesis GTPase A